MCQSGWVQTMPDGWAVARPDQSSHPQPGKPGSVPTSPCIQRPQSLWKPTFLERWKCSSTSAGCGGAWETAVTNTGKAEADDPRTTGRDMREKAARRSSGNVPSRPGPRWALRPDPPGNPVSGCGPWEESQAEHPRYLTVALRPQGGGATGLLTGRQLGATRFSTPAGSLQALGRTVTKACTAVGSAFRPRSLGFNE